MTAIPLAEKKNREDLDDYIRSKYQQAIAYYWKASQANRTWYKVTRSLTVIFGAVVTLISSLASSKMIEASPVTTAAFAIGTPIMAALLAIIAGFSQNFQWGSTWQNMVITAQMLQKELDTWIVTPADKRDYEKEVVKLNNFVITETEEFFERMLGSSKSGNHLNSNGTTENDK